MREKLFGLLFLCIFIMQYLIYIELQDKEFNVTITCKDFLWEAE